MLMLLDAVIIDSIYLPSWLNWLSHWIWCGQNYKNTLKKAYLDWQSYTSRRPHNNQMHSSRDQVIYNLTKCCIFQLLIQRNICIITFVKNQKSVPCMYCPMTEECESNEKCLMWLASPCHVIALSLCYK